MIRIRVLGSLSAAVGRDDADLHTVDLGGPRQRGVLALLLIAHGDVVSVDRLIEDLWHGEPPPRALGALQAYVSNLRRVLEPDRVPRAPATVLVSKPPGYAVAFDAENVDAWHFEHDLRSASAISDPHARRVAIERALAIWNGPAYAEFAAEPWAIPEANRLEELRLSARERLAAAALDSGDAAAAAAEAQALTREHPLREEGWRLLALARYGLGRQADALAALRTARNLLAEELGLDPGPALVQLENDILAQRIPIRRVAEPAAAPTVTTDAGEPTTDGFVGREDELRTLHAAAESATTGSRVALLGGEAGSGKSLLLNRFRRDLEASGWRVAVGRCPETEGAPPAWAWVEALRALAAEVDPGTQHAALAPLLDDQHVANAAADASFGRFLLHRAVADYLAGVARQRPLAILLDDVHRGDSETLALLNSVIDNAPVLAVVAYRPDEVSPHLESALAALAKSTQARLRLGGLRADHAALLLASISGTTPDRATVDALLDRTGGNPFYLRESARLLGSEGELVATSEVPEGVRDVLRRRFARLPELSVAILRMAAVIGRTADIDVLLHASEADEDSVLDAVEAGVLAGLLDEPAPGTIRFAHALVRETLYGDISRLRRSRWHLRVAEAIEVLQPNDYAALAHHFGESLSAGTARRAADYALAAAVQAESRFAHDAAAAFYARAERALARLPGEESASERVDVLARMSRSQILDGDSQAARQSRERAVDLARAANRPELLVRALVSWDMPTPWINRHYGTLDRKFVDSIDEALTIPNLDDQARVRLLIALVDELEGVDSDRCRVAAAEAEQLARSIGDPLLLGRALGVQSALFEVPGANSDLSGRAEEMITLGEQRRIPVLALLGYFRRAQLAASALELAAVSRHVATTEQLADRYQWRQAQAANLMSRGFLAHLRGDIAEADRLYREAHARFARSGTLDADGIYLIAEFTTRLTEGNLAKLAPVLEHLDTEAVDVLPDFAALAYLAAGQPDEARRLRTVNRPVRRDFFRSLLLTVRGIAVAALGEVDEAAEIYAQLLDYRGQIGGATTAAYAVGPADTPLGDLALLLGDSDTAAEHFAAALDVATRCGCPQWITAARSRLGI